MKYIVTKDGRIIKFDTSDVEEEIAGIKYDILGFRLKTIMQFYNLRKEDIVKVVDAIEELCDEFVMNNEIIVGSPRDGMNRLQLADYYAKNDKNVFGAIWVKGVHNEPILKSVAKMNDKGELELL